MKVALIVFVLTSFCDSLDPGKSSKPTRKVEITPDEEKVRDAKGFQAIQEIHKEMDDDHSGSIDRAETSGFMTEDMNMRGSDRTRREKEFHADDDAITVNDLWEAWFESSERAWTTEELVHWLSNVVNLPQYAPTFEALKLDGIILPRLAVHNSTFMTKNLNIKSSVHRQKLRLSALDVVLFGYRDANSKAKDIALALLLLLLSTVIALLVRQRRRASAELCALSNKLEELHTMQNEFDTVQEKLRETRSRRPTVDDGEIENLKNQLDEAHRRLELNSSGTAPLILQPLLRKTCEVELNYLHKLRAECVVEMQSAIDEVDKLRKKQGTLFNSLKLATGASTGSDQIDSRIFNLKSRMEDIQASNREAQERWLEIEALCGFSILYPNETSSSSSMARSKISMVAPSVQSNVTPLYRDGSGSSSSASLDRGHVIPPPTVAPTPSIKRNVSNGKLPHAHTLGTIKSDRVIIGDGMSECGSEGKPKKRDVFKQLFSRNKTRSSQ